MSETPTDRDRNLLFGLLAVQLQIIAPTQFVEAVEAWVHSPDRELPDHLSAAGALSRKDRELLLGLVTQIVSRHGDDATLSLASFNGEKQVGRLLEQAASENTSEQLSETLGLPRDSVELGLEELAAVEEVPGRYSRTNEYSRGGMGRIMLVHDEYLGRDIALKELLPSGEENDTMLGGLSPMPETSTALRRFLREARLTGQLEHPSIVPVYELGRSEQGHFYYTMKLVRGKTLSQVLKGGTPLERRLRYLPHFLDLCQAIAYAHSRGVIHRDIKPANVMVGTFGETVVIDWGLAKVKGKEDIHKDALRAGEGPSRAGSGQDTTATAAGTPIGTPVYMPPEQAEGRVDDIDERSDVYSLGAVLYVLLTGKSPFGGGSPQDVIQRVVEEEPPPVCLIEPRIPAELAGICRKAMQKNPEARYQSARKLAEEIVRYESGALVHSYDYSLGEMLWRFYAGHKVIVNAVGIFLVLLAALGTYSYSNVYRAHNRERDQRLAAEQAQRVAVTARQEEEEARARAEHEAYVAQIRLAQTLVDNESYRLARSELWKTDEAHRNWEWGYLLNVCTPEVFTIPDCYWAAYSPDGSTIAALGRKHPPRILDAATGEQIATFEGRADLAPVYGPDGNRILSFEANEARISDARTGAELVRLVGHEGEVNQGAFSADANLIATGSVDGTARLWDAQTGEFIRILPNPGGIVWHVAFSPDSARLAVGLEGRVSRVWEVASGTERFSLDGGRPAFSPDGSRILTDNATAALVWDAESGQRIASLETEGSDVTACCFSPDGLRVLTVAGKDSASLWDVQTGSKVSAFRHGDGLDKAVFNWDGTLVMTYGFDGVLQVWAAASGEARERFRAQRHSLTNLSFNPSGKRMVTAGREGKATVWSLCTSLASPLTRRGAAQDQSVAFSRDGARYGTVTNKGRADVFDAESDQLRVSVCTYADRSGCLTFHPSEDRLTVGLDAFTPMVWDLAAGTVQCIMIGHTGPVTSLAFHPNGDRVASGSWDNTVRIWEARTGEQLAVLTGHSDSVLGVAYSEQGDRILTVSADKTAKVWDEATGRELRTMAGHADRIMAGAFSCDGSRVATGSEDHTVSIWEAESGEQVARLVGHSGGITGMAFAPDSRRLMTCSLDGAVKIWDAQTGDELARLPRGFGPSSCVAMAPDGIDVLAGSFRGRTRLCRAAPWRLEDLPGNQSEEWLQRYGLYRAECFRAAEERPTAAPATMFVATTEEVLLEALQKIVTLLETEDESVGVSDGEDGVLVRRGDCARAVARLCLAPGDRILSVDGRELTSREVAIDALEGLLERRDSPEQRQELTMVLTRAARRRTFVFRTLERRTIEYDFTFAGSEALSMMEMERDMLEHSLDAALQVSHRNAEAMGEPVQGARKLRGMWVIEANLPAKKWFYLALKLGPGERMTRFNGRPVTDIDEVLASYGEVIRRLKGGEELTLEMETERGEFQRVKRRIRVE